jgi:protein TonB
MFGELVESRRQRHRRGGGDGIVVSVIAHAAIIGIVTYATAVATEVPRATKHPELIPLTPPREPLPTPTSPGKRAGGPGRTSSAPAAPSIPTPIEVHLPPIDQPLDIVESDRLASPRTFETTGDDSRGGTISGTGEASGDGMVYVDKPAAPMRGNPAPDYPSMLRATGAEGVVTAQFTVDTTGRVEPGSIQLETTANDLFALSVQRALERSRFTPAEYRGHKVRMRMRQDFVFRIEP